MSDLEDAVKAAMSRVRIVPLQVDHVFGSLASGELVAQLRLEDWTAILALAHADGTASRESQE